LPRKNLPSAQQLVAANQYHYLAFYSLSLFAVLCPCSVVILPSLLFRRLGRLISVLFTFALPVPNGTGPRRRTHWESGLHRSSEPHAHPPWQTCHPALSYFLHDSVSTFRQLRPSSPSLLLSKALERRYAHLRFLLHSQYSLRQSLH
jgi:hypothetical protein